MADDVKNDQAGSSNASNTQSTARSNKRVTRSSSRNRSANTISDKQQLSSLDSNQQSKKRSSTTSSKRTTKKVKTKDANQQKQVELDTTKNTTKNKNKPENKSKLESKAGPSKAPEKLTRKSNTKEQEKDTQSDQHQDSNPKPGPSEKPEAANAKSKNKSSKKKKVKKALSEGDLLRSPRVVIKKAKSDTTTTDKRRKRKAKDIPAFSPKKLRSSSTATLNSSSGSSKAAKTGGRTSRLRNSAANSGEGSSSSAATNLGSCASSRRQRRTRARGNTSVQANAMECESNNDNNDEQEQETNEDEDEDTPTVNTDDPTFGAVASFPASGGSSSSQDGDGGLGLEESDISRLQALLEARGLPPHLFGSLGPRMHLLLHKTFNSSAGTKAQQLITSMQSDNEGTQLQGVMEMCQLLVMGNEETLGGFPVKQVVPILITLLQMEHNFDIMNHACRALTYLMEALPRSSVVVIDAVPTLLEKLQTIQCMDVAEQSLTALEMLSKRHGKNILQAGGLGSSLLFLDFFSIVAQRSALAIAANCCHSVTTEEFHFVKDSIEILSNRLMNQDKKSLECVCSAFARLVDNIQKDKTLLENLCQHGLLANLKQLLMVTPPIISSSAFVMVIRMLAVMCSSCPSIAVQLMKLDITETIRYLLIGSNEIPADEVVELVPRSPQELYEITCLICELLPSLPTTGVFAVDIFLRKGASQNVAMGTWQWKDDRNTWHSYLWVDNRIIEAAYQSGEDEINLSTLGRNYIIDFTTMQQINEDTGTIRAIERKSGVSESSSSTNVKTVEDSTDDRAMIFNTDAQLGKAMVESLISVVYDVYYSSVGPAIKHKCLSSLLKMLYHSPDTLLKDVLSRIPISSYIAGMLSSQDLRITCSALQKADILMSKLTDTFHVHFRREGVMHKIQNLSEGNLCSPSSSPNKEKLSSSQTDEENNKKSQAIALSTDQSSTSKKRNSVSTLAKSFEESNSSKEGEVSSSSTTSRLAAFKSKKRSLKRFGRQRASKSSSVDESNSSPSTSSTTNKKLLNESQQMRPKSATFSSSSLSGGGNNSSGNAAPSSSKGSFFSNFTPRWGRSQSYNNTNQPAASATATTNSNERTNKEQYAKEQEQNREKVKAWIKKTAEELYNKYFSDEAGFVHPALNILQTLTSSSEELSLTGSSDETALKNLRDVLLNHTDQAGGVSPFEIVHSGMVAKLLTYLTCEGEKDQKPRCTRIKLFLTIFLGLDGAEFTSSKVKPSQKPPLVSLIQKLNLCINQLEQFPVKCQDIPGSSMAGGSRGSSALRFFNTHQIKEKGTSQDLDVKNQCKLQRDPGCTNVKQWSGGAVKIDPLALVQAIERYLVVRGYGRVREEKGTSQDVDVKNQGIDNELSDDDDRSDDEIEESWATQLQSSSNPKHILEFTLNGHILPYNMTVYQAVRQYANTNISGDDQDVDDDSGPFGRASIWSSTHTLQFRPITQSQENKSTAPKRTKSDFSVKSILRSKSGNSSTEAVKTIGSSSYLMDKLPGVGADIKDPSVSVICLMRVLYYLNKEWSRFFSLQLSTAVISSVEFINAKLTAKATRQLQDPLIIMTGNLPNWLSELAKTCPFIFPFECRQLLFYTTTFDRDRAVMKLQETIPDLANTDSSDRVTPRLDKKKRTVSRTDLLKQAENVINDFVNTRSLLEVQYEGEVGTGLGPTLEFYTLVSKEFQKTEQEMWRGEEVDIIEGEGTSQKKAKYYFSKNGLFPSVLPKNAKTNQTTKVKNKFRFLGKFIAKACMDSRMIDISFSQTFYKLLLDPEQTMDISDLQHVDITLHKSLSQLNDVVLQKKKLESDETQTADSLHLALSNLTLDGVPIEDLGLDFLLPGTNIELKKNGKDTPVTINNLEEYLQCVVQHSLKDGVSRQVQAFREGFVNFCPTDALQMFYPEEMELLFCGCRHEQWDVKELMECCRADHGYTTDSRAVKFLFEIMSKYTAEEQRMFLQFITGSPKLPVGGFRSLNPPLTIVRKTVEDTLNPDDYLPSVMTCVNYLKLPDYSTLQIMSNKLRTAYDEGKNAFHLS